MLDFNLSKERKNLFLHHIVAFLHLRALAFKELNKGNLEAAITNVIQAIANLELIAPAPMPYDPSLERMLLEVAKQISLTLPPSTPTRKHDKIKIAHISPVFMEGGGHGSGFLGFLASHDREKFDVVGYSLEYLALGEVPKEYTYYSHYLAPTLIKKIDAHALPIHFFPSNIPLIEKIKQLYLKLIEDQIDVAVLHAVTWDAVSIVTAMLNPGCKFVYLHIADSRLNVAPYLLKYHVDAYTEAPCKEIATDKNLTFSTILGACDFTTLEALQVTPYDKESAGFSADSLFVGTFGAQHKIYTPDNSEFLRFIKELLEKNQNLHYFLLGAEAPYLQLPQVLSNFMGPELNKRVHLLGMRTDFLQILKTLDLYVDSFPIGGGGTIYQAMACGVPILLRKCEGEVTSISSLIKTEEAVASSTKELTEKALELLSHPQKREKLALKMSQEFHEFVHPKKIIAQYEAFFEKISDSVHATSI